MRYKRLRKLAPIERPREKMRRYGPSRLNLEELLAILLDTGTKERDVVWLSERIAQIVREKGWQVSLDDLTSIEGVGLAKASKVLSAIEIGRRFKEESFLSLNSPEVVFNLFGHLSKSKRETFVALYLDSQNKELGRETISLGSVNEALVHPREVFEPAVRLSAVSVIVVHNHPSGDPTPSQEDVNITRRLAKAGEMLGIELLDHIIVGRGKYVSFREEGLL